MNNTIKFSVDVKNNGKRLDVFLTNTMHDFTRSFLKKLIENKHVKLNDIVPTSPSTKVKHKDKIEVKIIEKNIQDYSDNKTRFVLLGLEEIPASESDKTSIVFSSNKGKIIPIGIQFVLNLCDEPRLKLPRIPYKEK